MGFVIPSRLPSPTSMTLQVHFSVSDGKRNNRSRNAPKFWKESHDVDWDDTDDAEWPRCCDATDGPCESHVHIEKVNNAFPVFLYIITVNNTQGMPVKSFIKSMQKST